MLSGDEIKEVKLMFASPEEIRRWSHGEVTESETINYRTHKPEKGGLYAEEIFGPEEDYKCACGKYEGKKYEGINDNQDSQAAGHGNAPLLWSEEERQEAAKSDAVPDADGGV